MLLKKSVIHILYEKTGDKLLWIFMGKYSLQIFRDDIFYKISNFSSIFKICIHKSSFQSVSSFTKRGVKGGGQNRLYFFLHPNLFIL